MEKQDTCSSIDELYNDYKIVQEKLMMEDPSTAQSLSIHLTKILILTCASYYEQQLVGAYIQYAKKESDYYGNRPHGFDNDQRNKSIYNKFTFGKINTPEDYSQLPEIKNMLEPLNVFGDKFRNSIIDEISGDIEKEGQVKDFQELFALRNLLAHQTYVGFARNTIRGKSFSDIKQMHDNAYKFVIYLKQKFK